MVSVWHEVIVWATRSTRDGSGMFVCEAPAAFRPAGEGEGGGDAYALALSPSLKNEYDISFDMQSRLAIMSFSLRVSHASRRGSNISRGLSPPWLERISSSALVVLSRRGAERLASFEDAIVSSALVIRTIETLCPLAIVIERL